jgi:ABC-type glycerol-3-phosphate transport system permease component
MSRLLRHDTRVQILLHALLLCLFVIWAYPVVWTLTSSLKSSGDLYSAPWSLPDSAHVENIANAWVQGQLGQAFLNSAYVTVVSVSLILLFAVPAAFGFACLELPLHTVLGLAILVPLMIPSEVILVPLFVIFRVLGLLNTLEGLITLEVAGGVAFATVVLTTFFRGVPRELEDAARIDGASSVLVLRHIILPLAAPGIAAVMVFQSVFVWNDYFAPLIVIQRPSLFTVQLAMGNFSNFYATDQALLFAGLAIAMVPPLVVFAALQRSFIQGLTVGAMRD